MKILVVEDETKTGNYLKQGLTEAGFVVDLVRDGNDGLHAAVSESYDLVVLDIMLPGIDGLETCRRFRRQRNQTPILLLTAKDSVGDRVAGLDAGADDYLTKPFAFAELAARLRALSRRPRTGLEPILTAGDLRVDPANRQVWKGSEEIVLPNKEFRILEYLLRHPNRVLTRSMIAEHVWDYDFPNVTNVIDVHIRSLRKKLDDPYPGEIIQTIRGAGYRLVKS